MSRLAPSQLSLVFILCLSGCQFAFERELDPGDIRGTVVFVDANGARLPAAGAHVSLGNAPVVVKADAKGKFVLRGLPFGRYDLSITWKPAADGAGEPAGLRLRDIDMSEKVGAVDLGTVDIAGLGAVRGVVVGAETDDVEAVLAGVGKVPVRDGAFSFEGLSAGDYEVALVGERGVWSGGSVKVKPRAATDVEIDTGKAPLTNGSITGRVLRADGGSLSGLSVFLAGADIATDAFNDRGVWTLASVTAGVYTLVAKAPGMYTTQVPYVVVADASVAPDLVLVPAGNGCALGGTEAGTAEDADGDGVPDADEPDVCLCHPGHVDADEDGACDDPEEQTPPVGCSTNGDCDTDEQCNRTTNTCEPIQVPACGGNDCADGGFCVADVCVECRDANDCQNPDDACNEVTHVCEPFEVPACGGNDCADGGFCVADVCVECRDTNDCSNRGDVCNEVTHVCEPIEVPACGGNDCADGGFCVADVCVECRDTSDCQNPGDVCVDNGCESAGGWSVVFDGGVTWQGDHPLATLGSEFRVGIANLPVNATYEVVSSTRPRAEVIEDRGDGGYRVQPDAIGALSLDVSVTLEGAASPEQKTVVVFVVHDPERALFFDPVAGDDASEGTLNEPKKDVGAYLAAMSESTLKRHLYVAAGDVTLTGPADGELLFDADMGSSPIIVTGGFHREDGDWHRDLENARTRFLQSGYPTDSKFTISGDTTNVVLDGLVIENQDGVICNAGATLRLLNSHVAARKNRALETNDCGGLAAGNILLPGDYEYLNATVTMNASSGAPSTFRLMHNLVVAKKGKPYSRYGRLGGDIRYNVFLGVNNDFTIDSARELDGNSFSVLDRAPLFDEQGLVRHNQSLLPRNLNNGVQCVKIGDPQAALNALYATGHFALDTDLPDCDVHTPLPTDSDLIDRYALRYDRNGETRGDTRRSRGPTERAYDLPRPKLVAQTPASDVVITVGTPFVVQGTTNASLVSWGDTAEGMLTVDSSEKSQGRFTVTAGMVGGAALRLDVFDYDTYEKATTVVRFDVRPNGNLVFVDFNAPQDGDGGELSPRNVWPSPLAAGTDLLVAEATTSVGSKLPTGWLPDGVRVFGGYARAADGRFIRRLAVVETNLRNAVGTAAVQIAAGDTSAAATTRVVDGVTFSSGTTTTALVVEGPLLLIRSQVISTYYGSPSVMEVGAQSANLAVVGSAIAYRPSNQMGTLDLVRLESGAAPTFLLNDLQRGYGMSGTKVGSAFRVMGASVTGVYEGNRYWVDTQGSSTYVFFDVLADLGFTPASLNGNGYAARTSTTFNATNKDAGNWLSIVTDPVDEFAANLVSDDCSGAWPFSSRWAEGSTGDCAEGAKGAGMSAREIESENAPAARVGAEFDVHGQQRSSFGASVGAVEYRDLSDPW